MPNENPRVIVPMPRELLEAVDDFRFDNRISSRAEAIRQLLRRSLGAVARKAPSPKRPRNR